MPDRLECTAETSAPELPAQKTENCQKPYPLTKRLLLGGAAALSDDELLGLLLRRGRSAGGNFGGAELAEKLLEASGGLAGLLHADTRELKIPGIGPAKRAAILALLELARRLAKARLPKKRVLRHANELMAYIRLRYSVPQQEVMGALFFDPAHRLLAEGEFFRGTLDRALVEPRAILRRALVERATDFVLFHTHPTGNPKPSAQDVGFTARMAKAGEILGVRLVDHFILGGEGKWTSLKKRENKGWPRRDGW